MIDMKSLPDMTDEDWEVLLLKARVRGQTPEEAVGELMGLDLSNVTILERKEKPCRIS